MSILKNLENGIIDIIKLAIIAIVCLVVILIGGYLFADIIGLIPETTGLHRSLSIETFMTDLPFIGANMIYLLAALLLLVIAVVAIELYLRKARGSADKAEKTSEAAPSAGNTGKTPEQPASQQSAPKKEP